MAGGLARGARRRTLIMLDGGVTDVAITLYFLLGGLLVSALGWRRAEAVLRVAAGHRARLERRWAGAVRS